MGKINGHSYVSSFSSPSKSGYAGLQAGKAHVCVEKAVSLHHSVKCHMPDCFSWPSKRRRQSGTTSHCFALRLIPPVASSFLCSGSVGVLVCDRVGTLRTLC